MGKKGKQIKAISNARGVGAPKRTGGIKDNKGEGKGACSRMLEVRGRGV